MKKSCLLAAIYTFFAFYTINGHATDITYDISWTGNNQYSMTGEFSFDDSLLGGLITANDVSNLSINGFLYGSLVGNFSGSPTTFNFDSDAEQFVIGTVDCVGAGGQAWGGGFCGGSGFGFVQGAGHEFIYLDGVSLGSIPVSRTTLVATRQIVVPPPTVLRCDLNNNGEVDAGDLAQVTRMVVDNIADDLDCDINNGGDGDGVISTADLVIVSRIVLGIIPEIYN